MTLVLLAVVVAVSAGVIGTLAAIRRKSADRVVPPPSNAWRQKADAVRPDLERERDRVEEAERRARVEQGARLVEEYMPRILAIMDEAAAQGLYEVTCPVPQRTADGSDVVARSRIASALEARGVRVEDTWATIDGAKTRVLVVRW